MTSALTELKDRVVQTVYASEPGGGAIDRGGRLAVRMIALQQKTAPAHQLYEPICAILLQGRKRLVLGEEVFDCGAGEFIVVSVDLPVTFQVSEASAREPYVAIAVALRPAEVASLLLETAAFERTPGELSSAGLGVSRAQDDLVEAVLRYVKLLDRPRDLAVLGAIAEREILWRLLCSEQGSRLRQIGLADSRLSQVGRAMRWMREHYQEPAPVEDLARLAAMSVTSFHRHFRAIALMSPMQYLKQIRLQEARARLLTGARDVATVGHAVGYDSPSQFSREYKRAYGAPPGQDARTMRLAQVAAQVVK